MTETPHFNARVIERLPGVNPEDLFSDIVAWMDDPSKHPEYMEAVCQTRNGAMVFRIAVEPGIFYAVVKDGKPMTVAPWEYISRNMTPAIRSVEAKRHKAAVKRHTALTTQRNVIL